MIKDHKSFLKVHPNTFRGQAAIEWLRGHAARALFGSEAEKEKNQQVRQKSPSSSKRALLKETAEPNVPCVEEKSPGKARCCRACVAAAAMG